MKKALFVLAILGVVFMTGTAERRLDLSSQVLNRASATPALMTQAAGIKATGKPTTIRDFGKVPVYFTPNDGQTDRAVDFYVQGKDKTVYFTSEGVTYALSFGQRLDSEAQKRWAVKMDFVGARKDAQPEGLDKTGAMISYFKGKPEDWHAGLSAYAKIIYRDLWPGIDLVYKGDIDKLKYEFIVHPGADPGAIRMALRSAEKARIDEAGRLEIIAPAGSIEDEAPSAFQIIDRKRAQVPMAFTLAETEDGWDEKLGIKSYITGFEVGVYDKEQDLILDPATLVYCGYLGGSDVEYGNGIAVDGSGNIYITGLTTSSEASFPKTAGPDLTQNGNADVFVAKINGAGTALIYCGYIGGSQYETSTGIAVDGSGYAYVSGQTFSTEATFPVKIGPDLTFNGGNSDAFVAKVKADGTGLVYCGYIGGWGDDEADGIAVDGSGNAYVAGKTGSDQITSPKFPVTVGPNLVYRGGGDGFVAKINSAGTALAYCGYLGGSSVDNISSIAVDGTGSAYVTGTTSSDQTTFPVAVGPDLTYNGNSDAFVAKVKADGTGLIYCGYIGGSESDFGFGIAVDATGNAYIVGNTSSNQTTFPVAVGPDLTQNGYSDAYVAKIKADGTGLVYCGYIGGSGKDFGTGIAINEAGNAYITGFATSTQATFPVLVGPSLAYGGGTYDAYVAKIWPTGEGLIYCGYIGGASNDYGAKIAADGLRNVYIVGYTNSAQDSFPVAVGPDLTQNGDYDTFVAKIQNGLTLTMAAGPGGTTSPAPGTYTYDEGASGNVQALPNSGYRFTRWTGDIPTGQETNATIFITMDANKSLAATFTKAWVLTIFSATGGTTNPAAGAHGYDDGTVALIAATAAGGYRFDHWTGDVPAGSATNNPLSLTMNSDKSITPVFIRQYTLTLTAGTGGTTNPAPGAYPYDEGSSASVQAVAAAAYQLDFWSGDASGSANPVTVVMNGNKSIQANFTRVVKPPLSLTGEKLANRSVSMVEYVARLRWGANTANSGTITYRVYQIENGTATAIGDVPAGTYEYFVRRLQQTRAYRFGMTAVNSQGWESDMVEVAVQ